METLMWKVSYNCVNDVALTLDRTLKDIHEEKARASGRGACPPLSQGTVLPWLCLLHTMRLGTRCEMLSSQKQPFIKDRNTPCEMELPTLWQGKFSLAAWMNLQGEQGMNGKEQGGRGRRRRRIRAGALDPRCPKSRI